MGWEELSEGGVYLFVAVFGVGCSAYSDYFVEEVCGSFIVVIV